MIRYITRHGQVISPGSSHLYPFGDVPLSELGREQARLLGERLVELGFDGIIISSPFHRTLETAEIIAELTGSPIYPFAPMHEIFRSERDLTEIKCVPIAELKERFPHIAPDAELPAEWRPKKPEKFENVVDRVGIGVVEIEKKYPNTPILYVGHGASVGSLILLYQIPVKKGADTYNCSLSAADAGRDNLMFADTRHLPYAMTTSNHKFKEEFDLERMTCPYEGEIKEAEALSSFKGRRILHIGDTLSYEYPFYKKLIELVRPDVIIHTGDMVDEVKVGGRPELREEYVAKLRVLVDMMKESGARLIVVAGNNDLPDEIQKMAPEIEMYEPNSVINVCDVECRAGHYVADMTFDKKLTFYGHSSALDQWKSPFNAYSDTLRFNANYGSAAYFADEDKYVFFKKN